jgi:lambda family phage portal protein
MAKPAALVAADGVTPLRRIAASDPAYRAGDRLTQELARWQPMLQSPDAAMWGLRDDIVARDRDLVRNNGFAAGAQQTLIDNIVGAQWTLVCQPNWTALGLQDLPDEERDAFEEEVEAAFDEWAYGIGNWCDASRRVNFTGLLRQAFVSWFDAGEFLAVAHWLDERVGPGLAQYATALQMVNPDRLSNPHLAPDRWDMRGGIELGPHGEPLAYHIRKAHPYDPWIGAQYFEWQRFERETEFGRPVVLHGYLVDGDGQTRGVSPLASVLETFKLLDIYERSEAKAAILNAMIAAVIETQSGLDGDMVDQLFSAAPATSDNPNPPKAIPGPPLMMADGTRIVKLPVGTGLEFKTPQRPAAQFAQFTNAVTRRLAAGVGMAAEEFAHDYSQTNYSSARASLLQSWKAVTGRSAFLDHGFASPSYGLFFEEALDRGRLELPRRRGDRRAAVGFYEKRAAWLGCDWLGPGRGQIDPVKERQAYQLGYETFTDTMQTANAEQGRNWRKMVRQAARETRYLARHGVTRGDTAAMMGAKPPTDNETTTGPKQ